MWTTTNLTEALTPTSVALGNFDGIHRGHRLVMAAAMANLSQGIHSTVVTFDPHPRQFFGHNLRSLLTPKAEKISQIAQLGLEQLVLLPFNLELAALSPREFVEEILLKQLQIKRICVGENFYFGRDRSGTVGDLKTIAQQHQVEVTIVPLQHLEHHQISSSQVRYCLNQGDVATANLILGYDYTLSGLVTKGQQLGRQLGFPTANLQLPIDKFLPRYGVYAVLVQLEGQWLPGVMNVGERPTVNSQSTPQVEVHLIGWQGDCYDRPLAVRLKKFLRPEQKFTSLDHLREQITADTKLAAALLTEHPTPQPDYQPSYSG